MANFKLKLILLLLASMFLCFSVVWAGDSKTNEDFLRETIAQSLNQSFSEVVPQMGDTLYLKEEGKSTNSWFLREELFSYLMQQNKEIFWFDSNQTLPLGSNAKVLNYRLIQLKIDYPKVGRNGFLGKKIITRQGQVKAFLYFIDREGKILWQEKINQKKIDKIDFNNLKEIENRNYPFLYSDLPSSATKKYVEPALVTAVVGGLIYLFFANR